MDVKELLKEQINVQVTCLWSDKIEEAMSRLPVLIEAIQSYSQEGLQMNHLTTEQIQTINGMLLEILTAMENKDYTLMADLLQYELAELIG